MPLVTKFSVALSSCLILWTFTAWGYTFNFQTLDRTKPLELVFVAQKQPGNLQGLNTETGGILRDRPVKRYDHIKPGTVIARLENSALTYELAQSRLAFAKYGRDLERSSELRRQGLISSEAYDDVELAYNTERNRLRHLEEQVAKLTVKAKAELYITEVFGGVGEYLPPGALLAQGYDISNATLSITLPPFYATIFEHMEFSLRQDDGHHVPLPEVRVSPVREASGALRISFSGAFTHVQLNETVRIVVRLHADYATLPFAAVFIEDGKYAIFTTRDDLIQKVYLSDVTIFSDRISFRNGSHITNYLRSVTGVTRHSEIEDILQQQPDAIVIQVQ